MAGVRSAIIFFVLALILAPLLSRKRPAQSFEKALTKRKLVNSTRARLSELGRSPQKKLNVLYIRRFPEKESGRTTVTTSLDLIQSHRLRELTCRLSCLSDINYTLSESNELNLERKIGFRNSLLFIPVLLLDFVGIYVVSDYDDQDGWASLIYMWGFVFGMFALILGLSWRYLPQLRDRKIKKSADLDRSALFS